MTLTQHSLLSAVGSGAIVATGGTYESAAAFFVMGVFIDFDHFPDYWRETGFNLKIRQFLSFWSARKAMRIWLPLHAWEWVIIGFVVVNLKSMPDWVTWGIAGWSYHLVIDQLSNGLHPMGYFISFRAARGFNGDLMHPKAGGK